MSSVLRLRRTDPLGTTLALASPTDDTFPRRSPLCVLRRLLPILLVLASALAAEAQVADSLSRSLPDSLVTPADTTLPSVPIASSNDYGVSLAPSVDSGLEAPIAFTSRDSLRIELAPRDSSDRPDDRVSLFGEATALYEGATLTAGRLEYLAGLEELRARPIDSDSGSVGLPTFTREGDESFTGRQFVYNLRTERGRVTGVRTKIEEGYLLGDIIKQCGPGEICASDAAYTTCDNEDHPHYALRAGRIKVEDGKRVFTGPVRLELLGLPTPLWLPFGFFPAAEGRRSGPLQVSYRQESDFGLTLDNVGWYWAISDYLDAQVAGKIGTLGSFEVRGRTQYNRRYAYSGSLGLSYGRLRRGERSDPDFQTRTPFSLDWRHNQTFANQSTLSGSVNLRTESQQRVATEIADQVSQSTRSSVSYSRSWPGVGRSLSLSSEVYQDFAQDQTTATLPRVSLSQQRIFPFKRGRDDAWYEKIHISYTGRADNSFRFAYADTTGGIRPDSTVNVLQGLLSPSAYTRATGLASRFDYNATHTIPIQAAFRVQRYNLSLTPSLTFTERWAGVEQQFAYVDSLGRAVGSELPGFTSARQVSASVSGSTEFFGTFPIRIGALDGVRHVVRPSATLRYEPDYAAFGFVREVQRDAAGNTRRYAILNGIPTTTTRTVSFGVENEFLARTARADSTGEIQRTTNRVLSLSLRGGYNFGDDERPIQDLSVTFNSQIYGFTMQGTAGYSAYATSASGDAPEQTYFDATGRPLRLTRASASASRTFGRSRGRSQDVRPILGARPSDDIYDPADPAYRAPIVGYVDYAAPISASFGANLSFQPAIGTGDSRTAVTLSLNQISAQITPNWAFTGSTGFDVIARKPTITRVGLRRDLHCWEMRIDWTPIGPVKGFGVSLGVKSGYLSQFLRLDAPRSVRRTVPF
ncbi:MAG: putative LPS assembly protein LptD [Rubricoccaceae bacterium]